ncbi:MAG: glutamine--fructose-6-phosphate transaminase (isomerizing) [Oscillospiraceae bacterium]|nr:glutamine--fructose-6-phosphate transaminase (isomerizing) [Oscillospiraceae bacterium]
MCGIVGYVGNKNATDVLLDGLRRLEYRGYDSAGIAVWQNDKISVKKEKGRLLDLEAAMQKSGKPEGNCGIGHTRWATHGEPSFVNSHPHSAGRVTLVHNGIIENYIELKGELEADGYTFLSQTDTECAAALLDRIYKGEPQKAISELICKLRGSFALAVLFSDRPNEIYAVRRDSPLIVGLGEGESFLASDIPAVLRYTKQYYLIEENEIVSVTKAGVRIEDLDGKEIKKEIFTANWSVEDAEKGGFDHFMLKEIFEEPDALKNTILPHVKNGLPDILNLSLGDNVLKEVRRVHIVGCGTAMHAGLVGKTAVEALARVGAEVSVASEFRYSNPILCKNDLVIVISQSGETADTLAALRLAKKMGAYTLAVVNVVGSSIAREADGVLFTSAGPEIAVASTKAYSVQCAVMYLFALRLALLKGEMTKEQVGEKTGELIKIASDLGGLIQSLNNVCKELAEQNRQTQSLFFIGRGMDYSLSVEGSLKLKEISYIHSEAYAAGELKHGTISLVTDGVPVIAIATQKPLFEKMISNVKEVKARGASVTLVCRKGTKLPKDLCDSLVELPDASDIFMPLLLAPFIQLFAYHTAVVRGCDVDKPRNLAKSVTVE